MRTSRRLLAAPLLALMLAAAPAAAVPTEIYLQTVGSVQGNIQGDATQAHHANWIEVYSFTLGIEVPIGTNGQPSGPARTSPLTITKKFDRSSVKLQIAASTLETFSTFTMDFRDISTNTNYYRITLTGARVSSFQQNGSLGGDNFESVAFMYTSITLTDLVRGTTVSYAWNSTGQTATVPPTEQLRGVLLPPAPNPTRGSTNFRFSLPTAADAELTLFDLQGRQVRKLHRGFVAPGPALSTWDGTDDRGERVPEGIYMAKLTHKGAVLTQRFAVVR